MGNDASESTTRKGLFTDEEGHESGRGKIPRTNFERQSTCATQSGGYEGIWEIVMPPSGISLVVPDIEYKCEHVEIPMDVSESYVADINPTGVVSAARANTLLKHIAGLTAIAHRRSVEARDELIRLQQSNDILLAEREREILRLKKDVLRNEVMMLRRDLARSIEEKLLATGQWLEGRDEFHQARGQSVRGQDNFTWPEGQVEVPSIYTNKGALLNMEVAVVHHTGFSSDSDLPTETQNCLSEDCNNLDACGEVKADAESNVLAEGALKLDVQGCSNSAGVTLDVSATSGGTGPVSG